VSQTVELPRAGGPGSGLGGAWKVIVRNDDHNTFDHVAETLSAFIPGVVNGSVLSVVSTSGVGNSWFAMASRMTMRRREEGAQYGAGL